MNLGSDVKVATAKRSYVRLVISAKVALTYRAALVGATGQLLGSPMRFKDVKKAPLDDSNQWKHKRHANARC